MNPIGPRACYDEGKRSAETLCFDFHRQAKVDIGAYDSQDSRVQDRCEHDAVIPLRAR